MLNIYQIKHVLSTMYTILILRINLILTCMKLLSFTNPTFCPTSSINLIELGMYDHLSNALRFCIRIRNLSTSYNLRPILIKLHAKLDIKSHQLTQCYSERFRKKKIKSGRGTKNVYISLNIFIHVSALRPMDLFFMSAQTD